MLQPCPWALPPAVALHVRLRWRAVASRRGWARHAVPHPTPLSDAAARRPSRGTLRAIQRQPDRRMFSYYSPQLSAACRLPGTEQSG